jgi:hypothetical protein
VFQALTEHWDGTAWSIVPSPSGTGSSAELDSTAAVTGSDVWAAGGSGSGTLIEQWNGTNWAVVTSPSPSTVSNNLAGIAVVAANDIWAVGSSLTSSFASQTLIEQWNGTNWAVVTSPTPGSAASLSGASADPASGQSWAVGDFTAANGAEQTLTEFNPLTGLSPLTAAEGAGVLDGLRRQAGATPRFQRVSRDTLGPLTHPQGR